MLEKLVKHGVLFLIIAGVFSSHTVRAEEPKPLSPSSICEFHLLGFSFIFRKKPKHIATETAPDAASAPVEATPVEIVKPKAFPVARTIPKVEITEESLQLASQQFVKFIGALQQKHIGFDQGLTSLSLALISREHVMISGSGGNGKSFFGSILDYIYDADTNKKEVISANYGIETTKSDIVGPLSPSALMNDDEYKRIASASLSNFFGARIEEFLDAPISVIRMFHEVYDDSNKRLVTLVATTNKTFDRLMVEADEKYQDRDLPRPTLNRFAYKIIVPRDFAYAASYMHMFNGAARQIQPDERVSWQQIITLGELSKQVCIPPHVDAFLVSLAENLKQSFIGQEITEVQKYKRDKKINGEVGEPPFVAGTYISKRALIQARKSLRAATTLRIIGGLAKGETLDPSKLNATIEDLQLLSHMLAPVIAADPEVVDKLANRELDPGEKLQIERANAQSEAFNKFYEGILTQANEDYVHWNPNSSVGEPSESEYSSLLATCQSNGFLEALSTDLRATDFDGGTVSRLRVAQELVNNSERFKDNISAADREYLKKIKNLLAAFTSQEEFVALSEEATSN